MPNNSKISFSSRWMRLLQEQQEFPFGQKRAFRLSHSSVVTTIPRQRLLLTSVACRPLWLSFNIQQGTRSLLCPSLYSQDPCQCLADNKNLIMSVK